MLLSSLLPGSWEISAGLTNFGKACWLGAVSSKALIPPAEISAPAVAATTYIFFISSPVRYRHVAAPEKDQYQRRHQKKEQPGPHQHAPNNNGCQRPLDLAADAG